MDHSHFPRLPPELRNDIYDLVLGSPRVVGIGNPSYKGRITAPITRVCRQLRQETRLLDYAKIEAITSPSKRPDPQGKVAAKWLRCIGREACSSLRWIDEDFRSEESVREESHRSVWIDLFGKLHTTKMKRVQFSVDPYLFDPMTVLPKHFFEPQSWRLAVLTALAEMGVRMRVAQHPYAARRWCVITLRSSDAASSDPNGHDAEPDRSRQGLTADLVAKRAAREARVAWMPRRRGSVFA